MKTVGLIWAEDMSMSIGKKGKIPWSVPEDLQHFKNITENNVVIMGRKTFESLGSKPLPNRTNIVVTRRKYYKHEGILTASSLSDAIDLAETVEGKEVWIIGGGQLLEEGSKIATTAFITSVYLNTSFADAFAPVLWYQDGWDVVDKGEKLKSTTGTEYSIGEWKKTK